MNLIQELVPIVVGGATAVSARTSIANGNSASGGGGNYETIGNDAVVGSIVSRPTHHRDYEYVPIFSINSISHIIITQLLVLCSHGFYLTKVSKPKFKLSLN